MTELEAKDLRYRYGDREVLAGASIRLLPGSVTLLAGRNGAGKSTLLSILAGIRKPSAGSVAFSGRPLARIPAMERARNVTLVPQESDAAFEFSGREVVAMGRHPHVPRFRALSAVDHAIVEAALASTDSTEFADRSIRTLSGGELRRIHIARALATQAPILLADEPTANLDLEHAVAMLDLMQERARLGETILISSHDINLIAPRCDAVALLHEGRIEHQGEPAAVLCPEVVAEVFGVASREPGGYFPRDYRSLPEPGQS